MHQEAGTLTSADGLTLATRCWTPGLPARGAVLIVHGLNEHSGRYTPLAEALVERGFAVFSYDHRHHGRSGGQPRGFVTDAEALVQDLALVLDWVVQASAGRPLFLLGHSLGAALATAGIAAHGGDDFAGVILSSAAVRIPKDVSPVLRRIAPLLGRMAPLLPTLPRDGRLLSRDPAVRRAWKRDPLIHKGRLRARTGQVILKTAEDAVEQAAHLDLPLLVMHGTADRITDPEGSRLLHDAAPASDKTLRLYDGYYHELFNDLGHERVLEDVASWLEARVG